MTLRDMLFAVFERLLGDPGIGKSLAADQVEELIKVEVEHQLAQIKREGRRRRRGKLCYRSGCDIRSTR